MSVKVTPNSPSQDYSHPDDHNLLTYDMTPEFKPFTVKTFSIKADGIACISNDVVEINTKNIVRSLGLKKENICRGKGPVDLLIGIDQTRMHTGKKKEKTDKKFPLRMV